jgi:DUF1365 family protein
MPDNVITFPEPAGLFSKRRTIPVTSKSHKNVRNGPNMHTLLFRSYDLIVQSDEADLVRDVCFNIDRAQTKLKGIRRRLQGVQEEAAAKVQLLTAADTKLTATIVAALLSTRGGNASA